MATQCPLCKSKNLKINKEKQYIYCEDYKYEKDIGSVGDCEFVFFLKQKNFGRDLDQKDFKKLLEGGTIVSKLGHKMILDLNKPNFTTIEWKQKADDAYL